jgi:RHS repeat-associated protein
MFVRKIDIRELAHFRENGEPSKCIERINELLGAWRSEFRYDAFGKRRVRREFAWSGTAWVQTNEVRYVYDGLLVLQERDANNQPSVTYTRGLDRSRTLQAAADGIGGLLARSDHSTFSPEISTSFYHSNGNGNITCLIGMNGAVVARYSYDPYGNMLSMSGPMAEVNLNRFSSKETHPSSGLVYYLYRYYELNLQRWVNHDPFVDISGSPVMMALTVPWNEDRGSGMAEGEGSI